MPDDGRTQVHCPACGEASPSRARFCGACGVFLGSVAEAERRIVTVLFADLTGFTHLSEQLDAEDVRNLISGCLDPLCNAVTRWGGFVDKFIGDCVMALFGAPVAYENEPERAVRAALDMQDALANLDLPVLAQVAEQADYRPLLTIGVATGPVVTGLFSGGGARNYTAVGDTVNVAARLQGLCDPGRIIVDEATFQHTRRLFDYDEERILQVKGRDEPVRARYVRGAFGERGEVRGLEGRRAVLVGRANELDGLRRRWAGVRDGACTVTLLAGAAGIGKSRLVDELVESEELAGQVARGRSYPYASSTPWEPISELIRDLHDLDPNLSPVDAAMSVAWADADGGRGRWRPEELAALSIALGEPLSEAEALRDLGPDERGDRIAAAVRRALVAGASGPQLLVLEDLHWTDRTTLDFLRGLSSERLPAPVFLLLVARPALPDEESLSRLFDSTDDIVELSALSPGEALELLDRLLQPHEVPGRLLERVAERSEGNPLFLEELVKSLFDRGTLVREDDVCRAKGDAELVLVPDSIESVLSTRIDGLDAEAKRVLQYAAIVGRRFWSGVLAEALAHRSVDSELGRLELGALVRSQGESVVVGDREFLFEHLLLQEVAYGGLLKGLRAQLHGEVADWLEGHLGERRHEHDGWIAFHHERSKTPGRAVPFLEQAAAAASERGALEDAQELLRRALAVARGPEDEARLLRAAEDVAAARGDADERLAAIGRLESLGSQLGDERIAADVAYRRARLRMDNGDLSAAREFGRMSLAAFSELGDISLQGDALRLLGRIEHEWGRYPEAVECYRSALEFEREAGDRAGQADMYDRLGLVEVDKDDFLAGLEYLDEALELNRALGHLPNEARILAHRATALRWLGALDEAEVTARRAIEVAERSGSRRARLSADFTLGMVLAARGAEEAVPLLRQVASRARDLGRAALEARTWLVLGETTSGEEARAAVERALELASSAGLVHVEIRALTRRAELALEGEDLGEADRASGQAFDRLRRHGNVQGPEEAVVYARARVLAGLGRADESERLLAEARRIIREKAERIPDPARRRGFLELDPNPEILAAGVAAQSGPG